MKNFFRISFLIALFFGLQFNSNSAEKVEYLKTDWSFKGPFGKFDRAALPWLDTSKIRSAVFRPLYKQFYWILVADVLILGYVGAMPAEGLYLLIARIATAYYFLHFLVVLPVLGFKERTTPVPLSITEPILGGSPNLAAVKKKDSFKDQ